MYAKRSLLTCSPSLSSAFQDDSVSIYLPIMQKSDLFKTVIFDGVCPRKTFSMGESFEKRYVLFSLVSVDHHFSTSLFSFTS